MREDGLQEDYLQSTIPGTPRTNEHQTKLGLKDFAQD